MKSNTGSTRITSVIALLCPLMSICFSVSAGQLPDPRVEALRSRIPNDSNVNRIAGFSTALVNLIDADTAYLQAAQDKDLNLLAQADFDRADALNCAMQIVNREKLGAAGIKLVQQVHTAALINPPGLMLTASELQQKISPRERILLMNKPAKGCS